MNIYIKKLTPDLADDYVDFFDKTPHNIGEEGIKCYCVLWRNDNTYFGNDHWYPTREERRDRALQFIKNGSLHGYLAYQGDEIIGWCNATGDCQSGVDYLRSYWPIEEYRADIKVKSVFCFMIAPQVQRTGVATKLLARVCEDAAADGFDFVEAYTNKEYAAHDHMGPLAMYEKCGFTQYAEREGKVVVRKVLEAES